MWRAEGTPWHPSSPAAGREWLEGWVGLRCGPERWPPRDPGCRLRRLGSVGARSSWDRSGGQGDGARGGVACGMGRGGEPAGRLPARGEVAVGSARPAGPSAAGVAGAVGPTACVCACGGPGPSSGSPPESSPQGALPLWAAHLGPHGVSRPPGSILQSGQGHFSFFLLFSTILSLRAAAAPVFPPDENML